jgi:hypothetical protein
MHLMAQKLLAHGTVVILTAPTLKSTKNNLQIRSMRLDEHVME